MQTQYQPKTGQACHCRKGQERDNCPDCEGTGQRIDFAAIRNRKSLCPFCGAGYHGEDTKPSVTCTRELWAKRSALTSALNVMVRAFNVESVDPLVAFVAIEQAKAVIEHGERICGEPLFDNGKPSGVCAQPFGTEHSHQD